MGDPFQAMMSRKNIDIDDLAPEEADLPYLILMDEDVKEVISFDLGSLRKEKNEKGWNCYVVDMEPPEGPVLEDQEVPFYAMKAFYDCIKSAGKKSGWLAMSVQKKRISENKCKIYFRDA